jgi:hypothetical protein
MSIVLLFARIKGLATDPVSSAQPLKAASCVRPSFRQFDFWVGDWHGFVVDRTTILARAQVDRVLDDCVLLEHCEGTNGLKGQSLSLYDTSRRIWHQSWVVEGKIQAGEMVLRHGSYGRAANSCSRHLEACEGRRSRDCSNLDR